MVNYGKHGRWYFCVQQPYRWSFRKNSLKIFSSFRKLFKKMFNQKMRAWLFLLDQQFREAIFHNFSIPNSHVDKKAILIENAKSFHLTSLDEGIQLNAFLFCVIWYSEYKLAVKDKVKLKIFMKYTVLLSKIQVRISKKTKYLKYFWIFGC